MRFPRINPNDLKNGPQAKMKTGELLRRLAKYLRPFNGGFMAAFLLTIAGTVTSLIGPKLCGRAIDLMSEGDSAWGGILRYALVLLGLYILSAVMSYTGTVTIRSVTRRVVRQLRCDVFDHITRLPVSFFDYHQAGDIMSVMSYDVDTMADCLAGDIITCLKSAVMVVGSLVMMLTIAPALVLVFAVTIPLAVFLTRFITTRSRPLFRARSARLGQMNGYAEDMISGQKTTRAYGVEDEIQRRFERYNQDAVDAYTRSEYAGTLSGPTVNFVNNLSLTLISLFGAIMFMYGYNGITAGDISSFVLYSRKFFGPINEVANIIGDLQSAMAAAGRVFMLLDEPTEPADAPDAETLTDVRGQVDISHLRFGYVPGKTVIHDLSFRAEPGQIVAIVGHTGAGKTTIINLLMRFYEDYEGTIKIDGRDIKNVTRDSLRQSFSMVLQDTWLFNGTVFENVAYGRSDVTREDVERVCKEAMIHSFIMRLPKGYDTVLGDDAVNISKGQMQLLTIARAMLADAPMLILDEATSNVDTRSELRIQEAMSRLMSGKTCFIIAHRLSTIRSADNILVMRDGDVVEQGTHEELMAIPGGVYAEMYNS